MKFKARLEPSARLDIQESISWYNEQQKGLGKRFHKEVKDSISSLKTHSKSQIRYDTFRCRLVRKFPYMMHFEVVETEGLVVIYAIVHTSRNPDEQWMKK